MKNWFISYPRNWIISYPRSGNTWLRYCVEYLSKKPTIGYGNRVVEIKKNKKNMAGPLQTFVDLGVDLNEYPILHKRHKFIDVEGSKTSLDDKIIFLIRNYREAIIRHVKTIKETNIKKFGIENFIEKQTEWYIKLIHKYHALKNKKMIIYYEDLIDENLKKVLSDIFKFLEISNADLDNLISNLDYHKERSIKIYEVHFQSFTNGNEKIYHSNDFDEKYINLIDKYLNDNLQKDCFDYIKKYKE